MAGGYLILEFSKKLAALANFMFFAWVTASYILSWKGLNPVSDLSIAIVTQCIATNLGYFAYQWGLKSSRNKSGVDENGVPFEMKGEKQ